MLKSLRLMKMSKFTKMKNNIFAIFDQFKKSKKMNMYKNGYKCIQRVNMLIS